MKKFVVIMSTLFITYYRTLDRECTKTAVKTSVAGGYVTKPSCPTSKSILTLEASVLIKGRRAPFCQVLTSFPGVRNYAKVLHAKAVATGHTDYHLCDIIACRG